jgi:hypothetical protein
MADAEQRLDGVLTQAIGDLAAKATAGDITPAGAAEYANAAKDLAEALAWVRAPGHSH